MPLIVGSAMFTEANDLAIVNFGDIFSAWNKPEYVLPKEHLQVLLQDKQGHCEFKSDKSFVTVTAKKGFRGRLELKFQTRDTNTKAQQAHTAVIRNRNRLELIDLFA